MLLRFVCYNVFVVFLWFPVLLCFPVFLCFFFGFPIVFLFSYGFPVLSLWGQNLKGRPPRKRNVSRGASPPPAWHNWLIYLNNLPTIKCKLFNARAICLHLLHCGTPPPPPVASGIGLACSSGPPLPPCASKLATMGKKSATIPGERSN